MLALVSPRMSRSPFLFVVALALAPSLAHAACVNKFVRRTENGTRQVMTLLTGKLTFAEAEALSKAISEHQSPPIEWLDDSGKSIAKQLGPIRAKAPLTRRCAPPSPRKRGEGPYNDAP